MIKADPNSVALIPADPVDPVDLVIVPEPEAVGIVAPAVEADTSAGMARSGIDEGQAPGKRSGPSAFGGLGSSYLA